MFQGARIKLTLWYLAIIMAISLSFSTFVYRQLTSEIRRGLRLRTLRVIPGTSYNILGDDDGQSVFIPSGDPIDVIIYEDVRKRILMQLLLVNAGIGVFSAIAGYFLAGKTLHPIETMVEDQKRFVADASHELRTPLTSMKTEIEVALREENLEAKEARELLKSNLEEVDKMQTLTNYLLSMSRYQNAKVQLPLDAIAMKDAVTKAIQTVDHKAKEKNITIDNKIKIVSVKGNTVSITELFTILLDNAIKYSHPKDTVIVRSVASKKFITVLVQDHGMGMKSTDLPYIFNRFYRADSSRAKSTTDGYGLGLSIAKNIVDLHHGKIEVESEQNKGTTFKVSLPKA